MRYIAYSKALHSTWVFSGEYGTLFDCGEGCGTALSDRVFAVERILLTHHHADHIAGLPNFFNLRNHARGATDKPLALCYPQGNGEVEKWIEFSLGRSSPQFPLTVQPLVPAQRLALPLRSGAREVRWLEAFSVAHDHHPCLGYRIMAEVRRLKPEFRVRPAEFFRSRPEAEKELLYLTEFRTRVLYTGDAMPLPTGEGSPIWQADVVFHDATFLAAKDRRSETHASLEEVVEVCRAAEVKKVYAMHLSVRYGNQEIEQQSAGLRRLFPQLPVLPRGELVQLD